MGNLLEDGQVKLQSRLEQEEEAKAALLGRIQRLTKLILVSTKATQSPRLPQCTGPRRRHSFGEEELAYLPYKRRDLILDDENVDGYALLEGNSETVDDSFKEKRGRKQGLLHWFKLRRRESGSSTLTSMDGDKSSEAKSATAPSTPQAESINCPTELRISNSLVTESTPSRDLLLDVEHDREVLDNNFSGQDRPMIELLDCIRFTSNLLMIKNPFETSPIWEALLTTSIKMIDHIDLLREQLKILSGEVALHSSALKRLSEEATNNPKKEQIQMEMKKLNDEIKAKNQQIASLEKQMAGSISNSKITHKTDTTDLSLPYSELVAQLNEKSFELEKFEVAVALVTVIFPYKPSCFYGCLIDFENGYVMACLGA
ncbi:hypothetical protein ACLOJK_006602 [Asimina triloba]